MTPYGFVMISSDALERLFTGARTYTAWLPREVSDGLLHQVYDLMKWGPTSANLCPARIVFVRGAGPEEKLIAALAPTNVEKVKAAPVTAIIAYDQRFFDKASTLFPHYPAIKDMFVQDSGLAEVTALRNGSLQGAYFILAARALGLDCGPMSGFDNRKLDEAFFAGTTWKSNFICNVGYGDKSKLHPRLPRLDFAAACSIV
jgi:3-hydroxypropanoate dehydrogenase